MTTKELAQKNYPRCWTDDMIKKLVERGKLTPAEYEEITGNTYPENSKVSDTE